MNLNAIRKVCLRREKFMILNDAGGHQWISDGVSAYPVEGIRITEDAIPALFWLDRKQAQNVYVKEVDIGFDERYCIEPISMIEYEVEDVGAVWFEGALYRALRGQEGLMFVDVEELKPAEPKDGFVRFTERRRTHGSIIIAAYSDMFVSALVGPKTDETAQRIGEYVAEIARIPVRSSKIPEAMREDAHEEQIGLKLYKEEVYDET